MTVKMDIAEFNKRLAEHGGDLNALKKRIENEQRYEAIKTRNDSFAADLAKITQEERERIMAANYNGAD